MEVREYHPANWLTSRGVRQKQRIIEGKGLPDLRNWRFITLTLDPTLFPGGEQEGYERGKDRLRRFLSKLRKRYGEFKWAWKLEFTSRGWAHWHLFVELKHKFSSEEMSQVGRMWGLGRTNIQRVRGSRLDYLWKYAFKAPFEVDGPESCCLPAWFLDFVGVRMVRPLGDDGKPIPGADKVPGLPRTYGNVRFWQTCRGFYTGRTPEASKSEPKQTNFPLTARQKFNRHLRTFQLVARGRQGEYRKSRVVETGETWSAVNGKLSTLAAGRFVACVRVGVYEVPQNIIENVKCLRKHLRDLAPLHKRNLTLSSL